jgi:hypothetical protein
MHLIILSERYYSWIETEGGSLLDVLSVQAREQNGND